jgi:hypothetical protein
VTGSLGSNPSVHASRAGAPGTTDSFSSALALAASPSMVHKVRGLPPYHASLCALEV